MAKLSEEQYKNLISEFPEYNTYLKKSLQHYKDPMKKFLMKTIKSVEFFNGISKDAAHDIMYSLRHVSYERGQILLKPDD